MAEQGVFETRLRAALARYVADGPTDFDALEFARAVAAAEPRRHGRLRALRGPTVMVPSVAWLLLATALLLAGLMASALLTSSRPAPDLSSWQRVVLPVPAGSGTLGRLSDVTPSEDGYLAVGNGGSVGGLVWTSRDGLDWALLPTGDTFANAELHVVVRTDTGYIALGHDSFAGTWRAGAWRSSDGRTWRPAASIVDGDEATVDDVAFAGGRYVAVGWGGGTNDLTPRIWASDDAERWEPAADFAARPSFMGAMVGVAPGGPGFVAVGLEHGVWTSADGDSWTPSGPQGSEPLELGTYDVTAGRDGRVVVAGRGALVHVSDDGALWTTYPLPRSAGAGVSGDAQVGKYVYDYSATGVTATDWGYAVIGEGTWSGEPVNQTVLWTSRDGTSWLRRGLDIQPTSSLPLDVLSCGDALVISAGNGTWVLPGGASRTTAP
jgi:hypothetical protein